MLSSEIRDYFGITRGFGNVGRFKTDANRKLIEEIKIAVQESHLVVISGIIGCGKTSLLLDLKKTLIKEKNVIVSRSLAVEKDKVNMLALLTALFSDLATEPGARPPTKTELRERKLLDLFKKAGKPVALFVDDAHALHAQTLTSLKRLMELIRDNGSTLSVVLAGHPKLGNDLRRATMEEIGGRAVIYQMDSIAGKQREYIEWLLSECTTKGTAIDSIIETDALDYLAERLATPLQIHRYLEFALQESHSIGQKPVTREIVDEILARDFDDLEPKLVRQGYNIKVIASLLNVPPKQVRSFLNGQLDSGRTKEIRDRIQKAGIPLF